MCENIKASKVQSINIIHSFQESTRTWSMRYLGKVPLIMIINIVSDIVFNRKNNSTIT
jgi:hypothetical protein